VRTLALKHRVKATGTGDRLAELAAGGHMNEEEARGFRDSHDLMVRLLVDQQVAAAKVGAALSNRIDPKRFRPHERRQLKQAFKNINALTWVMQNALSTV
ncbi:MAG TPA: putative nucleotidyltransferase substrate binding domain-containing protein, partial [Candidatus Omnitrophota bacterium]|nr:putative nucleotidyltransferase substrate binding domain-containing protein [Candidatus Omnitrophota bacterium]